MPPPSAAAAVSARDKLEQSRRRWLAKQQALADASSQTNDTTVAVASSSQPTVSVPSDSAPVVHSNDHQYDSHTLSSVDQSNQFASEKQSRRERRHHHNHHSRGSSSVSVPTNPEPMSTPSSETPPHSLPPSIPPRHVREIQNPPFHSRGGRNGRGRGRGGFSRGGGGNGGYQNYGGNNSRMNNNFERQQPYQSQYNRRGNGNNSNPNRRINNNYHYQEQQQQLQHYYQHTNPRRNQRRPDYNNNDSYVPNDDDSNLPSASSLRQLSAVEKELSSALRAINRPDFIHDTTPNHHGSTFGNSSNNNNGKSSSPSSSTSSIPDNSKFAFMDETDVSTFETRVPEPAMTFPFELDDFQKRAIMNLEDGRSVFVAAHTSAGKTAVAEYAIAQAASFEGKAFYTSPIKSLSNQKLRDFRAKFDDVGLVTGDVSINETAQCVIMTTEILRSMLYRGADVIRDVRVVVFDEVQFLNDEERGVVWEETIIMLPPHITILMLSATVPNALQFSEWVGRTKDRCVAVVTTDKRPVPLKHTFLTPNANANKPDQLSEYLLLEQGGKFREDNFRKAAKSLHKHRTHEKDKKKEIKKKEKSHRNRKNRKDYRKMNADSENPAEHEGDQGVMDDGDNDGQSPANSSVVAADDDTEVEDESEGVSSDVCDNESTLKTGTESREEELVESEIDLTSSNVDNNDAIKTEELQESSAGSSSMTNNEIRTDELHSSSQDKEKKIVKGGNKNKGHSAKSVAAGASKNYSNRGNGESSNQNSSWRPLVNYLQEKDLFPTIVFCFSKRRCEESVYSLETLDLLPNAKDKNYVTMFIDKAIGKLREEDRNLPQVIRSRANLLRGITAHHGGLLPLVKEITEMLFSEGYVKLLFSTETFAIGVNMPARSVVFSATNKHDGRRRRMLEPGEYTQMSGRAGRRGIDNVGNVFLYLAPGERVPDFNNAKRMMTAPPISLKSAFRLTYNMILNVLRVDELRVEEVMKQSFSEAATGSNSKNIGQILSRLSTNLGDLNFDEENVEDDDDDGDDDNATITKMLAGSSQQHQDQQSRRSNNNKKKKKNSRRNKDKTLSNSTPDDNDVDGDGCGGNNSGAGNTLHEQLKRYVELFSSVKRMTEEMQPQSLNSVIRKYLTPGRLVIAQTAPGQLSLSVVFSLVPPRNTPPSSYLSVLAEGNRHWVNSNTKVWLAAVIGVDRRRQKRQLKNALVLRAHPFREELRTPEFAEQGKDELMLLTSDGVIVCLRSVHASDIIYYADKIDPTVDERRMHEQNVTTFLWYTRGSEQATKWLHRNMDFLESYLQQWKKQTYDKFDELREEEGNNIEDEDELMSRCMRMTFSKEVSQAHGRSGGKFFPSSYTERVRTVLDIACDVGIGSALNGRGGIRIMNQLGVAIMHERVQQQLEAVRLVKEGSHGREPTLLPEYNRRVAVLERLGYIGEGGVCVYLKGRCACEVATADSVVLTEIIMENVLNELNVAEIASLLSALLCRKKNEGGEHNNELEIYGERYCRAKAQMRQVVHRVGEVQTELGVTLDFEMGDDVEGGYENAICRWDLAKAVYFWANGMSFCDIAQMTTQQEGDIVVCVKRLCELLRDAQSVAKGVGNIDLVNKLEQVGYAVRRDVVFNASLYYE